MKAVWLEEFGGPEVLVAADAPDPVPGPGQALIEVARGIGVEVAVDYREPGWAERVSETVGKTLLVT